MSTLEGKMMIQQPKDSLFDQVSSFENLFRAFHECSRGKRSKAGHQKYLFAYGEKLKSLEEEIKKTRTYKWGHYREFYVHDPKRRLVMAAPFKDRIVHTAIHRIIEPVIDPTLGCRTFACRIGKGNRSAVLRLYKQLQEMGTKRYCIKLDVQKYFQSVPHKILFSNLKQALPDETLSLMLFDLIQSHEAYKILERGIPIGNLTSQVFANFYLTQIDRLACQLLDLNFFEDKNERHAGYIRYMDDMVILTQDKMKAFEVANKLIDFAQNNLQLKIPPHKKMPLANDPVPFLGFVLNHDGHRVLRRNERKFKKKVKRLQKKGAPPSEKAHVLMSYLAWRDIPEACSVTEFKKE